MGDVGLGIGRPFADAMGVCLGECFDGGGDAAVGIAFAQDGVDCAAQGVGVLRFNRRFSVVLGVGGVVGDVVAVGLQFGDGGFQLGDGCADVGQFDDVCCWRLCQFAQFGQFIRLSLRVGEVLREVGDDAPCQ